MATEQPTATEQHTTATEQHRSTLKASVSFSVVLSPVFFRVLLSAGLFLWPLSTAGLATAQAAPPSTKAEELSAAARRGDAETVKKLLDEGVDPNTKFRYDATALTYACDHGHLEVVKVLLEHGANVNVKDTFYGSTPLLLAISPAQKKRPEHSEIAKLLIAK